MPATRPGGATLSGRIEPITAAEIDITHTFVPPRRSVYQRTLIRVVPDGSRDGRMVGVESVRGLIRVVLYDVSA